MRPESSVSLAGGAPGPGGNREGWMGRLPLRTGLLKASWRFSRRAPGQLALALIGVALGVAAVAAIDLTIASAKRAFELSQSAITGASTHQISGAAGWVDERLYPVLRGQLAGVPVAPIIERSVRVDGVMAGPGNVRMVPEAAGRTLNLLGVDPLTEPAFRQQLSARGVAVGGENTNSLVSLLIEPGAAMMSARTAAELGIAPGDYFSIMSRGRPAVLKLEQTWSAAGSEAQAEHGGEAGAASSDSLIIADISTVQEAAGMLGRLSRVELILDEPAVANMLRAALPENLYLETTASRSRSISQMTEAFELNLRMLALLALLVGAFLIYNTINFSVLRRQRQFAILRAMGLSRAELLSLVAAEAAIVGLVGAALGLLLGMALADGLLSLVTRTISDMYFIVEIRNVDLSGLALAKAGGLGVAAAVAAGLVPAWLLARQQPAALLRGALIGGTANWPVLAAWSGVGVLLVSWLMLYGGEERTGALGPAFVALFGLVAGAAMVSPIVIRWLTMGLSAVVSSNALGGGAGWSLLPRLAVAGVNGHFQHTAAAAAALMVALATTSGIAIMVDSFRSSVAEWLAQSLRADIYVGGPGTAEHRAIDPELLRWVESRDVVTSVSLGRRADVRSDHGEVSLLALRMAPQSYGSIKVLVPSDRQAQERMWRDFDTGRSLLVTEPFARRHGVGPGDTVRLLTRQGWSSFPVVGVYRDYASERGSLLIAHAAYVALWQDERVTGMGIYLREDVDNAVSEFLPVLQARLPASGELQAASNQLIRAESMVVFDRTFAVTRALRLVALLVAVCGVFSAMLALQIARHRHYARLRALGLGRGGLFGLIQLECMVIGLAAGVASVPLGIVLAHALVHVINLRSFGWSMTFTIEPGVLLSGVGLGVIAAAAGGLWPAVRAARRSPAAGLRAE